MYFDGGRDFFFFLGWLIDEMNAMQQYNGSGRAGGLSGSRKVRGGWEGVGNGANAGLFLGRMSKFKS